MLLFFPLSTGYVDEVDNQANYQGYQYHVHFFECHAFTAIHFMNGEGICQILQRLFYRRTIAA